jgi:hypothetical protein
MKVVKGRGGTSINCHVELEDRVPHLSRFIPEGEGLFITFGA